MLYKRNSQKIIDGKISEFEKDMKDELHMKKKVYNLFKNEYEETLTDILLIQEPQFIDHIKNGVFLVLETTYTDQCLTNEKLKMMLENGLNEVKKVYRNDYKILSESWGEFEKNNKKKVGNNNFEILINFRKHCFGSQDYASHNCHISKNRFIIIKNEKGEKKFVICQACKKVYYTSFIKCFCKKCNTEYYSSLLKNDEDPTYLRATWEEYHCPQILKEEMKCIKCNSLFLIIEIFAGFAQWGGVCHHLNLIAIN